MGTDFTFGEVTHRPAQLLLFLCETKVHRCLAFPARNNPLYTITLIQRTGDDDT
jgi:hypothetical protein